MQLNYNEIESRLSSYEDLISIKVIENNEPFVKLDNRILNGYLPQFSEMKSITGDSVIVRESVLDMLVGAQKLLVKKNSDLSLYVTFGYRTLEIQTERFLSFIKNNINRFYENPYDLYNAAHPFIAVPTVAGHPTGGSVDVTIKNIKDHNFLNFGSAQYDFSTKDCYVFINTISDEAMRNRMLLRDCMLTAGFAPYDGEWWHFSYGERDWAHYYKKPNAIYGQVKSGDVKMKS